MLAIELVEPTLIDQSIKQEQESQHRATSATTKTSKQAKGMEDSPTEAHTFFGVHSGG
jgi:hypothetical protein